MGLAKEVVDEDIRVNTIHTWIFIRLIIPKAANPADLKVYTSAPMEQEIVFCGGYQMKLFISPQHFRYERWSLINVSRQRYLSKLAELTFLAIHTSQNEM